MEMMIIHMIFQTSNKIYNQRKKCQIALMSLKYRIIIIKILRAITLSQKPIHLINYKEIIAANHLNIWIKDWKLNNKCNRTIIILLTQILKNLWYKIKINNCFRNKSIILSMKSFKNKKEKKKILKTLFQICHSYKQKKWQIINKL
jgi:hypothetical protein